MTKFIFVTGGVLSALGKGVAAASIGMLLESHQYNSERAHCRRDHFNIYVEIELEFVQNMPLCSVGALLGCLLTYSCKA